MKKILFTILCLLSLGEVWCQSSEPWFYEGKQWARLTRTSVSSYEWTITSAVQGSVEIDGLTYWKIYESKKEDLSDLAFSGHYFREADRKVYWYDPDTKKEDLYMDFNLEKGDTFFQMDFKDHEMWVIAAGDTILSPGDGKSRKYMEVGFVGSDHVWDVLIEGIGSMMFGIERLCIGCTGGGSHLLCCHDAENTVYMSEYNTCFREVPTRRLVARDKQWAVWTPSTVNQSEGKTVTSVVKDSKMVDNKLYNEVWSSTNQNLSDMELAYYIREDGTKVYVYNESLQKEYLWFDFGLEVGDQFSFYTADQGRDATVTVVAVTDTIFPNSDDVARKCIYLEPSYYGIMVESIGSLAYGISDFSQFPVGDTQSELLCYHAENRNLVYQSEAGTCYKGTGMQVHEEDALSVKVECLGDGKISFNWDDALRYNSLCLYKEDGNLYQKRVIPFGERQLSVYGVSQGTYLYVLTTPDKKQCSGKVYVK